MQYHAVIFDLRGTLLKEPPPHFMLNATMIQARSLNVDPISFASSWFDHAHQTASDIEMPWIESNLQSVCDDLGIALDPMMRRRLANQREQVILKTLKPRRGAVLGLTRLRAAGLRTAVVGDVPPDVRLMFQNTRLSEHIDFELLSTTGSCRHSDKRVLLRTIYELGLPPAACLYVTSGGLAELNAADELGLHPLAFRAEDESEDKAELMTGQYPSVSTMIEVYWHATQAEALAV